MQLNKNINRNLLKEQSFPNYNINNNQDCILHFGIGNFHRAHQALYIHEILENNKNISIIGVNLRSEETNNKMQVQDYLYSLVRISNNYKKVDILNPIKKILFGLKHKNEIRNLIVSEEIKLITITVTEKGYHFDKNKKLNFSNQIINDLEDKDLSTLIGHLGFGIIERYKKNKKKLIVLSCDNLSENGTILKNLIKQFIEKKYPNCLDWFESNIEFPLSMIDGIVPNNNKQSEFFNLPYNDNAIVVTEPYRDWYIQSNNDELKNILSNNKIKFVEDVKFYENNKLKILNASHSALAYIGHLCGYTYVHEAIEDKNIYNFILNFLDQEVLPTLETKDDFNINEYKMKILERFKNTYIEDKLLRIAMDGSLKIPIRILDTYNNSKGETKYIQFIIASWLFFLFQIIEDNQNRLDDANKEYFYSVYKNNKDNFFEEIINNKNIFNLSVSKREEMLTAVKKNLNLMKENSLKLLLKEIIS